MNFFFHFLKALSKTKLFSFRILVNLFIKFFSSLSNGKYELPSQGGIYEITN